jgi:LuxR family maltose regulon positive regulatory protein
MVQSNLRIPKRNPKTLRRPRLLDQLHNNAHRKLTFVCAPAGYGKTTLLIDFVEDVDGAIFWYRITDQDTNLGTFFENLVAAFHHYEPKFVVDGASLDLAGGVPPRSLAIAFTNAVDQFVGEYGFLILDDYHIVSDNSEIVEFMDYLLEYLPDQLRVVIGSRSVYGIPTAQLYIQEQLAVIGTSELAFRPEELQDLCKQYYQINLTEQQTRRIIEESEGWIIAILLALRSENSTIEIPKILGAREHIYHYLANEVVSSLSEYIKEFMFATSIVGEFSIRFADYLLGIKNSEEIIKELDDLNLFLTDTDSGEEVIYRYHQLFSEFLQDQLEGVFESKVKDFHHRAALWFDELEEPERAVYHYIQAGDIHRAAEVIDRTSQDYYISGQTKILREWYRELIEHGENGESTPILLLGLAKHLITHGEYSLGKEYLDIAEPALLDRADFDSYANLLVTRGMLHRFTGEYEKALLTADQVQALVEQHKLDQLPSFQAERIKGIVSYFMGQVDEAFTYLEKATAGFKQQISKDAAPDVIHDLMMTLADIGYFGLVTGRIFDAQRSFRDAVELTKKIPGNLTDIVLVYNNYGYLNYLLGNYQLAWRAYSQGIQAARVFHSERSTINILNGQADVLCALDEDDDARGLYEQVLGIAEENDEKLALVDAFSGLAEVETKSGFFNKALYYAREIARIKSDELSDPEHSIRLGKIYLAMGQKEMALDAFESAVEKWGENPPLQQATADGFFHYAVALFQLGHQEESIENLKRSYEVAAMLGYDQFLVLAARKHKSFLEQAAGSWNSPQLQSMLKRTSIPLLQKSQLESPPEETQKTESSLQVTALGKDSVRLDGELIQPAKWLSAGARAMFFFILDRKEVTKEQIALEFWPDFSPGKVNSNFHATLWRVRNALGGKNMIEFKGNAYRLNPEINLFYDVDQLESLYRRINHNSTETEDRALLRQCVELYQGDFLTTIDMSWADQRRAELRNSHVQILSRLARIELQRNNFLEATQLFDQLIHLEPYQDIYHQEKMACLVGLGNVNGARQHFQDYRKFLQDEMGVEPDVEITRYFSSL